MRKIASVIGTSVDYFYGRTNAASYDLVVTSSQPFDRRGLLKEIADRLAQATDLGSPLVWIEAWHDGSDYVLGAEIKSVGGRGGNRMKGEALVRLVQMVLSRHGHSRVTSEAPPRSETTLRERIIKQALSEPLCGCRWIERELRPTNVHVSSSTIHRILSEQGMATPRDRVSYLREQARRGRLTLSESQRRAVHKLFGRDAVPDPMLAEERESPKVTESDTPRNNEP